MASVYEMVTERIIAELEKGKIPWQKPWSGVADGAYNRISKKSYSLLNQLLLSERGEYATYKQWKQLGGQVRKGAKSEFVVFWKMCKVTGTNKDGETEEKLIPMLRYYNVFSISQVDGVEPLERPENIVESIEAADALIESYVEREGINFSERVSNEAFYSPSFDRVVVPEKSQYENANEYYSTTFHELIHSTGHKTRLDRFGNGCKSAAFGSETYSKEELVAEIGSATILNRLGIETEKTFKNSSAYIQSWLGALKNDVRMIVTASSRAEKAVKWIFNESEATA